MAPHKVVLRTKVGDANKERVDGMISRVVYNPGLWDGKNQ